MGEWLRLAVLEIESPVGYVGQESTKLLDQPLGSVLTVCATFSDSLAMVSCNPDL